MENKKLEQDGEVVRRVLARRRWGLVQDKEAFMAEVLQDVQRRLREQARQSRRPREKIIEDATINRYGHIWHAACAESGTPRQEQAFKELHKQLYSVAYRVVHKNQDLAEESAQEALLIIYKKLSQVNDPGTFLSWMNVIVRRKAIEILKRENKRPEISEIDITGPDGSDKKGSTIERVIEPDGPRRIEREDIRASFREVIKRCLKGSKEGAKVIIRLFLEQRSVKQVADELDKKPSNIHTIKHRAQNSLRKCKDFVALAEGAI